MGIFEKMIGAIAGAIQDGKEQRAIEEQQILSQIRSALQDENGIWTSSKDFIDPAVIETFQDKWRDLYYRAKRKYFNRIFPIGFGRWSIPDEAQQFVRKYDDLTAKIEQHNELVAEERALIAANLILPVEGKTLDRQQLRCITKDVKNHLVLAGAGTGKTTTIVGYVKYLIKSGACRPEDILVLSFTNASATEMSERLHKELGIPIEASTFHKLGLNIISAAEGKKPNIYSADIRKFVRHELDSLVLDPAYLRKLTFYLVFGSSDYRTEFDFEGRAEYLDYLKYNPPVTLKKEQVKSYGEMNIANFLFQNGIAYEYEKDYIVDTRTEEYGQYRPDFYLPSFGIYIEYFGIDRNGNVPAYFSASHGKSASQAYRESMQWKRELHRTHSTTLIEVYAYEQMEGNLLEQLAEKLKRAGVVFSPQDPRAIWAEISGTANQKLDRLSELFGTVITLTKSNNCTIQDIRDRNHKLTRMNTIDLVLDLIEPIFNDYQAMLTSDDQIDFNDMINRATDYVVSGKYQHTYTHVVIDEYQDISQARYRLLQAMRDQADYRLFCVGDDWQSIYRFSGSDIGFILDFDKYWGATSTSRIETTYRFPASMIKVSSSFIMKNPEQKVKALVSAADDIGFSLGKVTGYTEKYAVQFMKSDLDELPQKSSVLFLGRYRFDVKMLDTNPEFSYRYNNATGRVEVKYTGRPDLSIDFMTVHSSKGLQADYVFILNNKARGMGFPSQLADAPVLQLLLDNCDNYPFAEERRLFYVALTRAKKKAWLVTIQNNESKFVQELDYEFGEEIRRAHYICPLCGGKLIRRTGTYGDFYGCSNYQSQGCQFKRKIYKSGAQQNS